VRISLRSNKLASDNRPGAAIRQHAKGRSGEYGKRLDDEEELKEDEKEQQFNNAKGMMLIWAAPQRRGLFNLCDLPHGNASDRTVTFSQGNEPTCRCGLGPIKDLSYERNLRTGRLHFQQPLI
jgi:hypothetical protein